MDDYEYVSWLDRKISVVFLYSSIKRLQDIYAVCVVGSEASQDRVVESNSEPQENNETCP